MIVLYLTWFVCIWKVNKEITNVPARVKPECEHANRKVQIFNHIYALMVRNKITLAAHYISHVFTLVINKKYKRSTALPSCKTSEHVTINIKG